MGNIIYILSFSIAFIIFLLFLFLIFFFIVKATENYTNAKIKQYLEQHDKQWYPYFIEGKELEANVAPHNRFELKAIEQLLIGYTKTVADNAVLSRISSFAELYLLKHYRKQLRRKKWSIRINTLYRIVDFRMRQMVPDVLEMLKRPKSYSKEEYIQIYKILVIFNHEDALSHLLEPKFPLGEFEYKKLLFDLEPAKLALFIDQFDELPEALKYIVFETTGIKHMAQYLPFLESRLVSEQSEIRIRALKSIIQIGVISNLELYLPFLHSAYWEERLMLAKLLAYVPSTQSTPYLRQLLHDPSWWVRSQATQTLRNSKLGKETLKSVIASSDDRYAIDIAIEALEKE